MTQTTQAKSTKYRDAQKTRLIPTRLVEEDTLKKPEWMRFKLPAQTNHIQHIKQTLRKHRLHSVCEEAACPNLAECFHSGTATFMILGDICTRRCPFCDVAHGRPLSPDQEEPQKLAMAIKEMNLRYVVMTSVNRDDLKDGGAAHFTKCVQQIRQFNPEIQIEILTPDFRGCEDLALDIISLNPPDVFNHNLENIPRLYPKIRPGANYQKSLDLLAKFKEKNPQITTKSGLMVGLGETDAELLQVMQDLRDHGVTMLTLGQYLQPSPHHLNVERYVSPQEFEQLKRQALAMGFVHAACGPFVRSSYHANLQALGEEVK